MQLLWRSDTFFYINSKTSSANYQLLKYLKMMSEPLSYQQSRDLKVEVSIEIQTYLPKLKTPDGLNEHTTNPFRQNKRQALPTDSFENAKSWVWLLIRHQSITVAVGVGWLWYFMLQARPMPSWPLSSCDYSQETRTRLGPLTLHHGGEEREVR